MGSNLVSQEARRRPGDLLRGLIPWIPLPAASSAGPPLILEGEEISSLLPYDRPADFLHCVRLSPDG